MDRLHRAEARHQITDMPPLEEAERQPKHVPDDVARQLVGERLAQYEYDPGAQGGRNPVQGEDEAEA